MQKEAKLGLTRTMTQDVCWAILS